METPLLENLQLNKKRLQQSFFPENIAKFLKTDFS